MKAILKTITMSLATVAWLAQLPVPVGAAEPADTKPPLVQLAILLDTSNSMDGLIEQTKGQLWRIINEFIAARQHGSAPEVQVALYEYGNNGLAAISGYIRQVQPLTTDLDKISEELFKLRTNGGEEYCGWVIRHAVENLAWSSSPEVYKAIFIAGNEPFTQGPVSYVDSCKLAIGKGILVNTIHCGSEHEGVTGKWQDGAVLAEGKYMFIDHNQAVVSFEAPQDKEIARLGVELNKTYIAYGRAGRESAQRQNAQDAAAASMGKQGSFVSRAVTKASANYRNDGWDLVDAYKQNRTQLPQLKKEELPVEMQAMTEGEQRQFVEAKARERAKIQARINQLNADRNRFVAEQMKKPAANQSLDTVMISTIHDQAAKRNFQFEK